MCYNQGMRHVKGVFDALESVVLRRLHCGFYLKLRMSAIILSHRIFIMPQAGCCVAVGLEYRCTYISTYRYIGVGTPVHLGLSVSWIACTAYYNNIVQLGCRLIA